MTTFIYVFFFTFAIFILYGLIGGCIIIPYRNKIRFPLLVSPMAGMLLWAMCGFILYQLGNLSFKNSIALVGVIFSIITLSLLIYVKPKIKWQEFLFVLFITLFTCAVVTYLNNYTSITFNNPGFLYIDGTDHMGYAAVADWLVNHPAKVLPVENPSLPYQSFPNLMTNIDARFGSFFTLAIISAILNMSSVFAFDTACGIILLSGYLGIAALFARSRVTLVILTLATLTGLWFQLGRSGYFGKIVGFPAMIYVLGLFFIIQRDKENTDFIFLITMLLITFAAAMVYPGIALAYFLIIAGFLFLTIKLTLGMPIKNLQNMISLRDNAGVLLIMIIAALATLGMLSMPKPNYFDLGHAVFPLDWYTIFLHQLDIQALVGGFGIFWFAKNGLFLIATTCIMIVLGMSIYKRNVVATSLLSTALFLLVIPFILNKKWAAYEWSSILYILSICGSIWLIDDLAKEKMIPTNKRWILFLYFLSLLAIVVRIPAFTIAIERYASKHTVQAMQYSKKEMDQLAKLIGNQPVVIDIPNVMFALPILVEYGRREMNLQWTSEAWKAILGYRTWQPPTLAPKHLVLTLRSEVLPSLGYLAFCNHNCHLVMQTQQYQLLSCPLLKSSEFPLTYRTC